MSEPVMVVYSEKYSVEGYPYLKHRLKPAFLALTGLIQAGNVEVKEPSLDAQAERLLARIHHHQHINEVKRSGHYDISLLSLAGVVQGAELLAAGTYHRGFAFVGAAGHHASPNGFWGFCFFNDVAAAIYHLREKGFQRFLILDVDPHFGDGTRNFFKNDKDVIHINFTTGNKHTLDAEGHNYDYSLSFNADDHEFGEVLDEALGKPTSFDFMFVIFGHDSHAADYGGFAFTDAAYPMLARKVNEFCGTRPLFWVLSGGANAGVASRVIPEVIKVLAT